MIDTLLKELLNLMLSTFTQDYGSLTVYLTRTHHADM